MTYSFIKPKIKPILSLFVRIWIAFYAFAFVLILCLYFFTLSSYLIMDLQLNKARELANSMNAQTEQNYKNFEILSEREALALQILGQEGNNEKLKLMVKNIFDFVIQSGGVKLEAVSMDKDSLELRGVTPTKEMFTLLIQTPLKSIFDESKLDFYPLKNGWFKFVSINKSINEEEQ